MKSWLLVLGRRFITRLYATDYFSKNRIDDREEQEGIDDLLYIDQHILKVSKPKKKIVA